MYGRLAQLVRAAALHAVGLGFESLIAHFQRPVESIHSKQTQCYEWAFLCLESYCLVKWPLNAFVANFVAKEDVVGVFPPTDVDESKR